MANDATAKYDNGSSSTECLSPRPDIRKPTGTNLDPIVLDDDDSGGDTTYKKESQARRKRRPTPYKRRRTSFNADDTNGDFIPPRSFTEIFQYESVSEEVTQLNDKIKGLQAEISRLKATISENARMVEDIAALSTKLEAAKKSVEELTVFKARFGELEIEKDKLREELKKRNAEAAVTQTELTETREKLQNSQNALQSARNEADLARRHLKKARKERDELNEQSLDDNRTIAALKSDCNKLSSERLKLKKDHDNFHTVRFNLEETERTLSATSDRLSKAKTTILDLRSQLEELEQERAGSKDRIIDLESQLSKHEEARATLESRIVELEDNEIKLAAATAKEEKEKMSLQSSLDKTKKAYVAMRLSKDKLQQERKEVVEERDEICRRLENLQEMDREDTTTKDKRIAELALIKQQLYKVSSDLQDAQQQIEEMEDHMERCPMARKSEEFYEHHNRKAELLADDIEETRQSIVSFTTQAV